MLDGLQWSSVHSSRPKFCKQAAGKYHRNEGSDLEPVNDFFSRGLHHKHKFAFLHSTWMLRDVATKWRGLGNTGVSKKNSLYLRKILCGTLLGI